MIALGHMDLTHQAQVNPLYGFHSTCYPGPGSPGSSKYPYPGSERGDNENNGLHNKKQNKFIFYPDNVQDVCMRKSFWDVSFMLVPPQGRLTVFLVKFRIFLISIIYEKYFILLIPFWLVHIGQS
jgi:hypothetical protein